MNCSTFRKRLSDYIEDVVQYDMKEAMKKHMEECGECKRLYEEEKHLDEVFKNAFDSEHIKFNSSRSTIMKSIDRNMYSASLFNKVGLHIKRYRLKYLSCAATLAIIFASTPLISKLSQDSTSNLGTSKKMEITAENSSTDKVNMDLKSAQESTTIVSSESQASSALQSPISKKAVTPEEQEYLPTFEKVQSEAEPDKKMSTALKASPSGKLQALLEGRGTSATDSGVAEIYIVSENKDKWRLRLVNNDINFSPMYLEWLNDENILITMGYAQGHATYGGNVYMINVSTGSSTLVYKVDSEKEQVEIIERTDSGLKLTVKVFTDDIKNKTKDEQRTIELPVNTSNASSN